MINPLHNSTDQEQYEKHLFSYAYCREEETHDTSKHATQQLIIMKSELPLRFIFSHIQPDTQLCR